MVGAAGEDEQRVAVDGQDQAVGDRAHRAADLGRRGGRGGRRAGGLDHFGVAAGMPVHYRPTKRALITHALDLLETRTAGAPAPRTPRTRPGTVRATPLDSLPLTAEDTVRDRIWVSFRDLPLADDGPAAERADRCTRPRSPLRPHSEAARELGELSAHADPEQLAAAAVAFTDGVVVQTPFDPGRFHEDAQVALPGRLLASLVAS
ncbi:TetR family transcriptional regulator C-terminal domain-containing protein [Streptomyces griseoluteus]|uniref:TetR family transcriptional regulator C-terminal domain-containing protein n=1 Tax=Streptomyces griseoluteus TaxID=29306 RepID=UPI0036FD5026